MSTSIFISYVAGTSDNKRIMRNAVITDCPAIKNADDIRGIEGKIEAAYKYVPKTVRILNWRRMED